MKKIDFPLFKTKIEGTNRKFDLTDFNERQEYFQFKAGTEIKKLRRYLEKNTFIIYLLGKKNSGKGTYAKMFREVVDPQKIEHFSVGDMVRSFDAIVKDRSRKKELINFLEESYRGHLPLSQIIKSMEERSIKSLLPTELVLALIKKEIAKKGCKALFIDGFPRDLDQVSYSLFFRDLIGYRDDPDIFVLIDVPENVIDERIKCRVVCPLCQTSRSVKLLPTKKIGYDKTKKEFYLLCDNPDCRGARMKRKEGDELGIEPIRARLEKDNELLQKTFSLYGIPKILLRNCLPVEKAVELVDDYEITPEYNYSWDEKTKKIAIFKKPWKVYDDSGVCSYSLMPPPVVVSLIKQLTDVLNL